MKVRHGLNVEDYLTDHIPARQRAKSSEHELVAREAKDAQRDHAEAARHAAVDAEELWDSGDRRARLAKTLMAALGGTEVGRDGVQARLAAERDQGTPPVDAVRSTQRGPKAPKVTGRGAGREREMDLG